MTLIEKVDRNVPLSVVLWAFPVAFLASLPLPETFKTLVESSTTSFAATIAVIFALLMVITFIAWRARKPGLAMIVYALFVAAILVNTVMHALQALALVSYVPGLVFAIVALPVSAYILYRLVAEKMIPSRHILPLIVTGALMQPIIVIFIVIG
jgi:hypothetical protein